MPHIYVQKKYRCTLTTIKVNIPFEMPTKICRSPATHSHGSLTQEQRSRLPDIHVVCLLLLCSRAESVSTTRLSLLLSIPSLGACAVVSATTGAQHIRHRPRTRAGCACPSTLPQIPDRSIAYIPCIRSFGRNQKMHFFSWETLACVLPRATTSASSAPSSAISRPSAHLLHQNSKATQPKPTPLPDNLFVRTTLMT